MIKCREDTQYQSGTMFTQSCSSTASLETQFDNLLNRLMDNMDTKSKKWSQWLFSPCLLPISNASNMIVRKRSMYTVQANPQEIELILSIFKTLFCPIFIVLACKSCRFDLSYWVCQSHQLREISDECDQIDNQLFPFWMQ